MICRDSGTHRHILMLRCLKMNTQVKHRRVRRANKRKRSVIVLVLLLCIGLFPVAATAQLPVIRISVETSGAQVQAHVVQRFAEQLAENLAGRYAVRFHDGASLYRDADVFRALSMGRLEIAVPGSWHIGRHVPGVGLLALPSLHGREATVYHALMESPVGAKMIGEIERTLDVHVLGRWIDLGHANLFTTVDTIRRPADIVGRTIQVALTRADELRIAAMGGIPATQEGNDLSKRLREGSTDTLLAAHETVVQARLWEHGIRAVYEDKQRFLQYVPICSGLFWDSLPPDVRQIIRETWDGMVDQARVAAEIAQGLARSALVAHGVSITMSGPLQIEQTRALLVKEEARIVRTLGISDPLYRDFVSFMTGLDSP